jgi:uncharacterized protein YjbJ (UPF0337 family)
MSHGARIGASTIVFVCTFHSCALVYSVDQKKERVMNWDEIKGDWKQFAGKVKAKWGKLTDDDLTQIGGKKDELVGKLQTHYGHSKEEAEKHVDDFISKV